MTGRLLGLLAGAAIVAGVAVSTARADGLPVLGVDVGSKGVTVPGATARYVTLWSGKKNTVVARVGGTAVESTARGCSREPSRSRRSPTTGRRAASRPTAACSC